MYQNWQASLCTCRRSECSREWRWWTPLVFCSKTPWLHSATGGASLGAAEPWSQCGQGKQVRWVSRKTGTDRDRPTPPRPVPSRHTEPARLTTAGTRANSQTGTCCRHLPRNSHSAACTAPWATRPNKRPACDAWDQRRSNPCQLGDRGRGFYSPLRRYPNLKCPT